MHIDNDKASETQWEYFARKNSVQIWMDYFIKCINVLIKKSRAFLFLRKKKSQKYVTNTMDAQDRDSKREWNSGKNHIFRESWWWDYFAVDLFLSTYFYFHIVRVLPPTHFAKGYFSMSIKTVLCEPFKLLPL